VLRPLVLAVAFVVSATPAYAELVFFATGRSLSVKAVQAEGDVLVLKLRSGGDIVCPASMIARVAPDEVPYPEPAEAEAAPVAGLAGPERPVPYGDIIETVAAEHGVDARLVRAVVHVESAYQKNARSPKGAMGLMQLMPATARQYGVADPYDPVANLEAGIRHLKSLLDRFPVAVALAAYNAGEAAVQRFRGVPPYPETRAYVSRILQLLAGPSTL